MKASKLLKRAAKLAKDAEGVGIRIGAAYVTRAANDRIEVSTITLLPTDSSDGPDLARLLGMPPSEPTINGRIHHTRRDITGARLTTSYRGPVREVSNG